MAILVDENTKLLVQGLTGKEGQFHGFRNRDYGTDLVAGVTPGKGGTDLEGVPIFNTVAEAVAATGANTARPTRPAHRYSQSHMCLLETAGWALRLFRSV